MSMLKQPTSKQYYIILLVLLIISTIAIITICLSLSSVGDSYDQPLLWASLLLVINMAMFFIWAIWLVFGSWARRKVGVGSAGIAATTFTNSDIKKAPQHKTLYTFKEAMQYLNCSAVMLWRLKNQEKIITAKAGRRILICKNSIDNYLNPKKDGIS